MGSRRDEIAKRRRETWIMIGLPSDKIVRALKEIVRLEKLGETGEAKVQNSSPAPAAGHAGAASSGTET